MISKYTVSGNGWSHVYEYTYDSRGNIATIKKNGTEIMSYLYDEQNQLIYENNAIENAAYYYAYLPNGNISVRLTYAYGTTYAQTDYAEVLAVDDYQYNNPSWADQLTVYNDSTITYDGIGNPLSYRGWTFDWQGRQLSGAVKGTDTFSYKYNSDGIRTAKTLNGTTTTYAYESGKLRAQKTGNEIIWFQYGADGTPMSMTIGSNTYYYVKNWQKDIVGLTDASGNLVVEYTYDAWGKLLSTTGTLATTIGVKNPFRYRGYYYDTETGFYYLQSRYYDPAIRRFISADSDDTVTATPMSITDKNLYAYCDNNPIMRADNGGEFWNVLVGAIVGSAINLVSSIVDEAIDGEWEAKDFAKIAISSVIGGIEGATTALCPALAVPIAASASATDTFIKGWIEGDDDMGDVLWDSFDDGGYSAITATMGSSSFAKGGKIVNKLFTSPVGKGTNPVVKKASRKAIKKAIRYITKEYASGQMEDFIYDGLQDFLQIYQDAVLERALGE